MRSNSGHDEARNNLHDPTLRDRAREKEPTPDSAHDAKAPADQRQGRAAKAD